MEEAQEIGIFLTRISFDSDVQFMGNKILVDVEKLISIDPNLAIELGKIQKSKKITKPEQICDGHLLICNIFGHIKAGVYF